MKNILKYTVISFAAVSAAALPLQAAEPDRTVEIIAGASPGGGYDLVARSIQMVFDAEGLVSEPVVVVNRPGAGGSVGWAYINRFPGDMHYISMTATALIANELTGTSPLSFSDMTPLVNLVVEDLCFAVNADSPYQTGQDLVEALQSDPRSVRFAFSTAIGNQNHIALALLADAVGVDVTEIPSAVFGGASEAVVTLLGGNADLSVSGAANYASYVEDGQLRCLAVTGPERLTGAFADVPTWTELDIDLVYQPFRGVIGPAGLSDDQIAFWEDSLRAMAESEQWKDIAAVNNWTPHFLGHEATVEFLTVERDRLENAYRNLGIIE